MPVVRLNRRRKKAASSSPTRQPSVVDRCIGAFEPALRVFDAQALHAGDRRHAGRRGEAPLEGALGQFRLFDHLLDRAGDREVRDQRCVLICFFDTLHDLGDPVAAARHAAQVLASGGTLMLVEPFAHDPVEDNLTPVGQLYYSGSSLICCAHAISGGGRLVLGAQAGPKRLVDVFRKAGFTHFRRAAQTPFNLVFEVRR